MTPSGYKAVKVICFTIAIIAYLIFMASLVSCTSNSDTVEIPKSEYDKLTGKEHTPKRIFTVVTNDGVSRTYDLYVGSDGHEYYIVYFYSWAYSHFIHYIECQKCIKRTQDIH